jgi:carbamoyl-phosphate synthase large subunit
MEHVERAGVHSGDSIAVYPAWNLNGVLTDKIIDATKNLAIALGTIGLINIQYIIHDNSVYIIEANPRASRTVPYISKVTGLPVVDVAVRCMLGEKLAQMEYGTGLFRKSAYFAVKVPAFSFEKLIDADTQLGPEMKSTGEVLGIARTLEEAMVKGLSAAGYHNEIRGGALFSVRAEDRAETVRAARLLSENGFRIYAAGGTAEAFRASGIYASKLPSVNLDIGKAFELIDSGKVQLIVSTSQKGRQPANANVRLRRKAVERGIPCFTSLDTALAFTRAISSRYSLQNAELVDINAMRHDKQKLRFVKMRGSGNDYIYFDCFDQTLESPESVSVQVSSRRFGIGSDGIVLIGLSETPEADARMRMFNADGSEAELAGNSLRCVAKYLYESGRVKKEAMTIATEGGLKHVRVFSRGTSVEQVCVSMGRVSYEPKDVPVLLDEPAINKGITIGGRAAYITCLSMGNPHCVIFVDDVSAVDVTGWGSRIEIDPLFPQRANVSVAQTETNHPLRMRTWERGIGETMACGTGACAAAAAAVRLSYLEDGDQTVHMPGGDLLVTVEGDDISLTGDAVIDFFGEINL